ncbi:hypothetical protein T492DRAFT_905693 [Pavlovales sp. CCMP2436]|nr:hypothetical protein T492DRAFT_905693 [Pavlovales sp. CCMP2436]
MSGVLVPDDENMIYDTPLHTVSEKVVLHPEVLLWHMRVIAVLVALITVTLGLLGLAWMRFWPVLTRVHNLLDLLERLRQLVCALLGLGLSGPAGMTSLPPIRGLPSKRSIPTIEKGVSKEQGEAQVRHDHVQGEIRKGGIAVMAGNNGTRRRKPRKEGEIMARSNSLTRGALLRRSSKAVAPPRPDRLKVVKKGLDGLPAKFQARAKELFNEFAVQQ